MTGNAVEFTGMIKKRGSFTLGPINLAIPRGVIFGLVGPNGAGKTTTLDLLAGLGRPDAGQITVGGLDVTRHEVAVKLRMAYAGPDTNYIAWGSVGRAIDFVSGFYPDWDTARCQALLDGFTLPRRKPVNALSFGEKTKLALVMALSRDPALLVLDEPTIGLDPEARRFLYADLLRRMEREDRTIIISTHQLGDLERFADQVVLLNHGQVRLCADMGGLATRFSCVDVAGDMTGALREVAGITVMERSAARLRLLVDHDLVGAGWENAVRGKVITETALTLEELYLALLGEESPAPKLERAS